MTYCKLFKYGMVLSPILALAQSLPPVLNFSATPAGRRARIVDAKERGVTPPDERSGSRTTHLWLFPLIHTGVDPNDFYGKSNWLSGPQQVNFLYGFNSSAKSLSVDLTSIVFPNGVQTSLGSTVTAATDKGTTATGQDSANQALTRLKAGGDFFVRAAYPIVAAGTSDGPMQLTLFSVSKMAFNISGLGSETTLTESTERSFNSSMEAYAQYGVAGKGYFYGAVHTGWQNVQPEFARQAGLPHRNFLLTQITAGLMFSNLVRVGFQRFAGPEQAFGITKNELSKWHLVLQLMPPAKK